MRAAHINLMRIEEELSAAHVRLNRVYIENMHYEQIITRFDKPHTFFYIDPPYFNCENYYGKGIFSREDFGKLADLLGQIKGKFTLSINNTPEIREIFKGFQMERVGTTYQTSNKGKKKVTELLVRNYKY